MSDTNLTQKFSALQSQLAQQHTQIMDALTLIRQDVNAIKTSAAATATHTGNMEAFTLQIAQSNVDIYNRLQTLNELFHYLSRDADQGLDLISRINYLQARASELNGYVDGLEGLLSPMGQQLADLLTQTTSIRFSVAPNAQSILYTRVNSIALWTSVLYQAITGNVGGWSGTTLMEYMASINAAAIQGTSASETNGQTLGDILAAVDGLSSCVCAPAPNVCDTGTALPVSFLSAEGPRQIKRMHAETTDIIDTGFPILCDSFFDPVNSGGISGDTLLWDSVAPAVFPVGSAEWCIRNETSGTTVEYATLDVSAEPHVFGRASVAPGTQQHIYNNGPLTWAAIWVSSLPLGQEDKISVIAFGAG